MSDYLPLPGRPLTAQFEEICVRCVIGWKFPVLFADAWMSRGDIPENVIDLNPP